MNLNDQAQEHFEAATTILPSESVAQMFLGEFLFFSGVDVSRGKECLLKAIELDPENAGAQYLLGKALYREENDDEALEYFSARYFLETRERRSTSTFLKTHRENPEARCSTASKRLPISVPETSRTL